MKMRLALGLAALALIATPAVAGKKQAQADADWWARLSSSKPDDISDLIGVVDDPMETFVRVDSRAVYQAQNMEGGVSKADSYLIAEIDRKTGQATYTYVFHAVYSARSGLRLVRMNAEGPEGAVPLDMVNLPGDVDGCQRYGCLFAMEAHAIVPRAVLDYAAAKPADSPWKMRLAFDGGHGDRETAPVEVAAFLAKVDAVTAHLAR